MSELSNEERRARVDARAAASEPGLERQFLAPDERMKLDKLDGACASLQDALKRIGSLEAHVRLHDSDAGWASYGRLYTTIEGYARTIVQLGGGSVQIPAKLVRAAKVPVTVNSDWLENEPKPVDQPKWMATPESRRKHSEEIRQENANAIAERECGRTGAGRPMGDAA